MNPVYTTASAGLAVFVALVVSAYVLADNEVRVLLLFAAALSAFATSHLIGRHRKARRT